MRKIGLFFISWFLGILVLVKFVFPVFSALVNMPNVGGLFVVVIAVAWTLSVMGVSLR